MRFRHAALSLAALLTVASCGTSAPSTDFAKLAPATIDAEAQAAMQSLTSVHIKGDSTLRGRSEALDLSIDTMEACVGTATSGGDVVHVMAIGPNEVYIKASLAYWERFGGQNPAFATFANKWLTGFPSWATANFAQCSLSDLLKSEIVHGRSDAPRLVGTTSFEGEPAVEISVGNAGSGGRTTVTIQEAAPHYVLEIVRPGRGSVTFSQFDVPVNAVAPSEAVNVSSLAGGAS